MTRTEVLQVARKKKGWLLLAMRQGRFPRPDADFLWSREVVEHWARNVNKYCEAAKRAGRRPRGGR